MKVEPRILNHFTSLVFVGYDTCGGGDWNGTGSLYTSVWLIPRGGQFFSPSLSFRGEWAHYCSLFFFSFFFSLLLSRSTRRMAWDEVLAAWESWWALA